MNPPNERPSLLMINDDCLMQLFQWLELVDFVNLAVTCSRLRTVADFVSGCKFKEIDVKSGEYGEFSCKSLSKSEFSNALAVIGEHVLGMVLSNANQFILETIPESCKNIESLWLMDCVGPIRLHDFQNLKTLDVSCYHHDISISTDVWENIFASNPNLKYLFYCNNFPGYEYGFMELLTMLPKLKSLHLPLLPHTFHQNPELKHLLGLSRLTELGLYCNQNLNELLVELAKRLKLSNLDISMNFNADSLRIINLFDNLKSLRINNWAGHWEPNWASDGSFFPSKLQWIEFVGIEICCTDFLTIVKSLKYLKVFLLGIRANVYWDDDKCKLFYRNNILYMPSTSVYFSYTSR